MNPIRVGTLSTLRPFGPYVERDGTKMVEATEEKVQLLRKIEAASQ